MMYVFRSFLVAALCSSYALPLKADERTILSWMVSNGARSSEALTILKTSVNEAHAAGVEPALVLAIIKVESGFNTKAVSKHDARGLMQVHYPAHKHRMTAKYKSSIPEQIKLGVTIYKECLSKKKTEPKALSCYAGGSSAYATRVLKVKHEVRKLT